MVATSSIGFDDGLGLPDIYVDLEMALGGARMLAQNEHKPSPSI